jgi:hypothetical protein
VLEATDVGIGSQLLLVTIRNGARLRLVLIDDPLLPSGLVTLNLVRKSLEEGLRVTGELVLRQSLEVEPGGHVHPGEVLDLVRLGGTCLEEENDITGGQQFGLDHDASAHHELEGVLVTLEQTSVDVPVGLHGKQLDNVMNSLLDDLGLLGVVNGIVE